MCANKVSTGTRSLLEIQAKCREWGQILRRNGWRDEDTGTHRAAAETPEAKTAELEVMSLIEKHERLLMECWTAFARGPSTPLDRAFEYIGIHLDRGPEALKHNTVALAECLTVEVTQPNVAEPYRKPTFIVQLGRWARKLTERAEQGETQADEEGQVDGEATKQRRGRWPRERTQREVAKYLSERTAKYNELVPPCLAGNPEARRNFLGLFGPKAIADAIGDGCKRQNVGLTQAYRDRIKRVLGGKRPKDWTPPEQDDSDFDNDITNMRTQAGGRG